jgi:hypothetical protein
MIPVAFRPSGAEVTSLLIILSSVYATTVIGAAALLLIDTDWLVCSPRQQSTADISYLD